MIVIVIYIFPSGTNGGHGRPVMATAVWVNRVLH